MGSTGARSAPRRETSRGSVLDLLGAASLWGGMYVVSAATFDAIPPLTLVVLRLLVGIAVLWVVFRGRVGFGRAPFRRVVAAGGIVAVTIVLQFAGTSLTGGAEGALLTTTTPAFVLVFGVLLEGQRVARLAWLGVLVALVGVAALAAGHGGATVSIGAGPIAGDAMLVASAASWALFSSVGRPLVERVGAFRAIFQASCVAVVLLLPFVPVELAGRTLPAPGPVTVAAVLYLGIGATAIAWSLWYRGYAAAPATISAAAFFAQPVVGAVLGVALLGEELGPAFVLGAVLVTAGIATVALAAPPSETEQRGSRPVVPAE
jgi:drug/metabolite transporter (DMT)-like permease